MGVPDRFSLLTIFRDHWRSLIDYRTGKPDYAATSFLVVLPLLTATIVFWKKWSFSDAQTYVAAVTLLAGVLFAAFTQLTAMRMRLDETRLATPVILAQFREAAAHTLVGSILSCIDAAVLTAGSAFREGTKNIALGWCMIGVALSVYLLLIFILVSRRMYSAYLALFEAGRPLPPRRRSASNATTGPN